MEKDAQQLLQKYQAGLCSDEEKALVETYYNLFKPVEGLDLDETTLSGNLKRLDSAIIVAPGKAKGANRWSRMVAAAAILVFLSAGLFFYKSSRSSKSLFAKNYKNDLAPGGNKALLKLANGKTIVLTDAKNGRLASDGNTTIEKTTDGEIVYQAGNDPATAADNKPTYNTVLTPKGGQYHLTLSDGTLVWLNAASSITYPTGFTGNERKVEITGEVYFEVAHNADKPFRVVSKGQVIEVLGTHFNVNAYADEPGVKTTLLEGSVKITADAKTVTIKPGEQAQLVNKDIKVVANVDLDETVAWKNGLFQFNGASIESIMRQAARWYNVDIKYDDNIKPSKTFSGNISRNSNASDLLEILSYTGVHFDIDGKKIIVTSE